MHDIWLTLTLLVAFGALAAITWRALAAGAPGESSARADGFALDVGHGVDDADTLRQRAQHTSS